MYLCIQVEQTRWKSEEKKELFFNIYSLGKLGTWCGKHKGVDPSFDHTEQNTTVAAKQKRRSSH